MRVRSDLVGAWVICENLVGPRKARTNTAKADRVGLVGASAPPMTSGPNQKVASEHGRSLTGRRSKAKVRLDRTGDDCHDQGEPSGDASTALLRRAEA